MDESEEAEGNNGTLDSVEQEYSNIPDGLPGSGNSRRRPPGISYSKPEQISIGNGQRQPRKRGRPPGSTSTKSATKPEEFWIVTTGLGLNFTSALIAGYVMHNPKYVMTKEEAEHASKAIIVVLWKYKQFREFAAIVNSQSDAAIIARGFAPYVYRVFLKEMINDVISGLFVDKSKSSQRASKSNSTERKSTQSVNGNSNRSTIFGNSSGDRSGHASQPESIPTLNESIIPADWRDV